MKSLLLSRSLIERFVNDFFVPGRPIPIIIFSARTMNLTDHPQGR